MNDLEFSRRQLLKGAGALIVSFNLFPPVFDLFAQSPPAPGGAPDPTKLDSWIAVGQDGAVTVFTSKVELGTGIKTALAQIAAEELDVPWQKIKVDMGDTQKTIDQATTSGSRTIERAGPQIRQAAAAARKELLRLASQKLNSPVDKLTVKDGVVSVVGNPSKKVSYAQLIGGKRFNVTTIEALGNTKKMHKIQQAFVDEQAVQCGYCINGMVMSTKALLDKNPKPTETQIKEALAGNLCRCGTHIRILRAVKRASGQLA